MRRPENAWTERAPTQKDTRRAYGDQSRYRVCGGGGFRRDSLEPTDIVQGAAVIRVETGPNSVPVSRA